MRAFAVGLALLLSPVASHADDICDPAKGTALRVVGVAANDTLNVRTGPTSSNALVARLAPGQVVTSTGRAAQAKGQCYTTCSGAEVGLNDTGRSIAYGCKAKGQIWYELRSAKGEVGWASGRYLEVSGNAVKPPVIEVLPPRPPTFEKRFSYLCSASRLDVSIYPGGAMADVTIRGVSHLVIRAPHVLYPWSYAAGDGARLRANSELAEWRWPDGTKVICLRR